ncbi:transmembrane anterior posterior transformation protein 1 homolog [Lampetra fluviatilis]
MMAALLRGRGAREEAEEEDAGDANGGFRTPTAAESAPNPSAPTAASSAAWRAESVGFTEQQGAGAAGAAGGRSRRAGVLCFLAEELARGYQLERNEASYSERRQRVYTFLRIPRELEKLMAFGSCLCLDAFLFVFTLLPLRIGLALLRLCTVPCRPHGRKRWLEPAQVCDILKGVIMAGCYVLMQHIDYSMTYHLIRGQSVIKLYIIYNMLEVADRLFSSFGQDILDALYWTATEPRAPTRHRLGLVPHLFMAVLYVFLHSILVLVQATTLNVAFNSHNKSLLTIMMSNNFVELKGSVFKKFEKNNLFQMSNSDIRERFHNAVLLLVVCLRNMEQFSWNPDHLWVLVPDVAMVVVSEVVVDFVKHAFITKFNDITDEVYSEYRASLAFDLVSSRQRYAHTDHSDSVSRRMGFIPLPLAVVLIRVVSNSVRIQGALAYATALLIFLGLLTLKVLTSVVLLGKSCRYVRSAKLEHKLRTPCTPQRTPHQQHQQRGTHHADSPGPTSPPPTSSSVSPPLPFMREPSRSPSSPGESQAWARSPRTCSRGADKRRAAGVQEGSPRGEGESPQGGGTMETPHRREEEPKTDLLEIDRFTICGNRID